ncbi:MAG: hypothetical protein RKO66_00370 [Candidatus Contendobacter sp.]|nr:hypothetical protein [Candidatus Contendobacter sp.]MDS4057580.1 hypothetical protein [Candidatus Contendobacter sp.]
MRQALNIKCWKCEKVFTMSAELSQKPDLLVEAETPCPFCQAVNQVIVRADQVQATVSYKDGQSVRTLELDGPGALLGQIFKGLMYYPPRPVPDPPPPKPTPPDRPTPPDKLIPSDQEHSK